MIHIHTYLEEQNVGLSTYAIVSYDGKKELILFVRTIQDNSPSFLESYCTLERLKRAYEPVEVFYKELFEGVPVIDDDSLPPLDLIEEFKKSIVDGWFCMIAVSPSSAFLPEIVDDIKIVKTRDAILYLMNEEKRA